MPDSKEEDRVVKLGREELKKLTAEKQSNTPPKIIINFHINSDNNKITISNDA